MPLFVKQTKVSSWTCHLPASSPAELILSSWSSGQTSTTSATELSARSFWTKAPGLRFGGGKRPAQCELQETTFPGLSLRKSRQPASCSQIPLPPSHEPRAAFDSAAVSSQICNIDWRTQAQSLSYIRPIRCELFYSNSGYISCKRKLGSHDIKVNMIVGGLLGALTATGPQKAPEIWLALNCICMCRTILYQM